MDALILSEDYSTSSNVETAQGIKAVEKIKSIAFGPIIKLILVSAIGLAAWTSWKPSLYDQFKLSNGYIVKQLSEAPYADFKQAAKYFSQGDYYQTRQIVSIHLLKNLNDLELAKKYAAILIVSDCFETSKQVLYPVYESKNQKDKAEAAYLLGLTFLKEENYTGSKYWLSKVPKETPQYYQAQDILSRLDAIS